MDGKSVASSVASSFVTDVVDGLIPVNVVEVGLLMDILTGGSAGGFVLTTCQETWLDRYLLGCWDIKVIGQNLYLGELIHLLLPLSSFSNQLIFLLFARL